MLLSWRIRAMYAELTWFQAAMYFSMHIVMQVVSPEERDVPGLGTHFSKQLSWSLWGRS